MKRRHERLWGTRDPVRARRVENERTGQEIREMDMHSIAGSLPRLPPSAPELRHLVLLADDLLVGILAHLDGKSLGLCACTCSQLCAAAACEDLWETCVCERWGWIVGGSSGGCSWRALFARLHDGGSSRFIVVGAISPLQGLDAGPQATWMPVFAPPKPAVRALFPELGNWHPLVAGRHARNMAAAVRHGPSNSLVVMGGCCLPHHLSGSEPSTLRSVERLEPAAETHDGLGVCRFTPDTWSELPSLATPRCCAGAACDASGRLYCVGGGESMFAHSRAFPSVELLPELLASGAEGGWRPGPSMLEPRCALGCAMSFATGTLFAVGGYAGALTREYLDSAERLDVGSAGHEARWTPLPKLSVRRAGCGAAVGPDERVYVVGGGPDGRKCWTSVEALDVRSSSWDTSLAKCKVGRHYNACAFGPDGRLYVSGAFRHEGQLDSVEVYDPRAGRWDNLGRCGVVVHFSAGAFLF